MTGVFAMTTENRREQVAVVGLGYVGLPVALAFARRFVSTVGFDVDAKRIEALRRGVDHTGEIGTEVLAEALSETRLLLSSDPACLEDATTFVVTVPTPIDAQRRPDLSMLEAASRMIGRYLSPGALVVFESTVYPGVTEAFCGPILAEVSGLVQSKDFHLGYSPERINPGDREHTLERVVKVVSGDDDATLQRVAALYEGIVDAGVHRAPSIAVAEAAKVIENTQRDLNIALMNELALICDRLEIPTRDVLAAAQTKWNFLPFTPGLVGGHCIGVDPYYLTSRAESLGYHPEVILAGRRINDSMGAYIAQRLIKLFTNNVHCTALTHLTQARVGILGLTFKENVPDLRNSRVPDIIKELRAFGVEPLVHDPFVCSEETQKNMGFQFTTLNDMKDLDALVLAVPHQTYIKTDAKALTARLRPNGVLMDVKSALERHELREDITYWSL